MAAGLAEVAAVIERLAALSRAPGEPGEHEAAEQLMHELDSRGARAWIEREPVHGTYWIPVGVPSALAAGGALAGRAGAIVSGSVAAGLIADDLSIGRRPIRRLLQHRHICNVVAELGDPAAAHTVVVHAHHDAAHTGVVFHPAGAKLAARAFGGLMERVGGTPAPMWGAVAGPAAVALGGLLARGQLRALGALVSAGYALAMLDIARRPAVPAANDNLSSVGALLLVAEALARRPPRGLRVLLLSTGSEESFLEGMQRFGERHFAQLDRAATTFVCLESIGSPQLMMLSGEGLLARRDYPAGLIQTFAALATEHGVALREPFAYRLATDGQVPQRAGYPVAVISSMDWYKAPSNYHWPTDVPANLVLGNVAAVATLVEAFVRRLERMPMAEGGRS